MRRRTFVAGMLSAVAAPAFAQTYPDRPIRLIVPSAPGGPTDIPARLLSQILPKLGQPAVVENRPGAGGAIGARAVATAAPDGYTLLVGNTSVLAVIPAVSASAGYDPAKSFAPVAKISESYQILVAHPATPWTSVKQLVDDAKANPGKFNIAHTGQGGLPHLAAELFKASAGVDLVGVPYKSGGEAVTALLGGNVHVTFEAITILLPLIREGKVRALGVTSRYPHAARERSADDDRGGRPGLRGDDLPGRGRARRHAARDRREAQRRDQRGPRQRRDARDDHQARRRADAGPAGGARGVHGGAGREVERGRAKAANIKVE